MPVFYPHARNRAIRDAFVEGNLAPEIAKSFNLPARIIDDALKNYHTYLPTYSQLSQGAQISDVPTLLFGSLKGRRVRSSDSIFYATFPITNSMHQLKFLKALVTVLQVDAPNLEHLTKYVHSNPTWRKSIVELNGAGQKTITDTELFLLANKIPIETSNPLRLILIDLNSIILGNVTNRRRRPTAEDLHNLMQEPGWEALLISKILDWAKLTGL